MKRKGRKMKRKGEKDEEGRGGEKEEEGRGER